MSPSDISKTSIEKVNPSCLTSKCKSYAIPRLFCSRCITFEYCRWNGQIIASSEIERMKPFMDFITMCPEKEIGLGVPRQSLRIIRKTNLDKGPQFILDQVRLVQPASEKDFTEKMTEYTQNKLTKMSDLDGVILKSKSPSCGLNGVKVYDKMSEPGVVGKTTGFFGGKIKAHFADFRKTMGTPSIQELIDFHTRHKFLLMAFNQVNMKQLGKLIGSHKKLTFEEIYAEYKKIFFETISQVPNYKQHLNVIQHLMGYLKTI